MATKFYERLRTGVEVMNRRDRAIPLGRSANVSMYQQAAMRALEDGAIPGATEYWYIPGAVTTIHGSRAVELARVLEAYALLMRNGVREFQPE